MNKFTCGLLATSLMLGSYSAIAATDGVDDGSDMNSKVTSPTDDSSGDKATPPKSHKRHKNHSGAKKAPNADSHEKSSDDATNNGSPSDKPMGTTNGDNVDPKDVPNAKKY